MNRAPAQLRSAVTTRPRASYATLSNEEGRS